MNQYEAIVEHIKNANNIVITSHFSPDGDSIGSSLALYHFIEKLGKKSTICHPDKSPAFLNWLEGFQDIVVYETDKEKGNGLLANADLIFLLDYNSHDRVGKEMEPALRASTAKKIMIDHHLNPETDLNIVVSDITSCSTCQLIFEMIDQSGNKDLLDSKIGTPIYLGIMTDSGSFRFPSVQARTHIILAELINAGVKHYEIHEKVYDTNTLDRLKLRGFATSEKLEILKDYPIAIISMSQEELERFNYEKGDTDGLVNIALSIQGIKMAAFFSEKDGLVKISLRAKGDYSVNQLASDHFEGGGHKYASGGISKKPLAEAIEYFKSVVPNYY